MTVSKPHDYLLEHGPSTGDELPHLPRQVGRTAGIQKFNPSARHGNSRGGHDQRCVYYVGGAHEPIEVIEAWLDANEVIAETASDWELHQRISSYGDEWRRASREIFGPFAAHNPPGSGCRTGADGGTCPLCGEEYERALADHLPNCEAG